MINEFPIGQLGEKFAHAFGDLGADFVDFGKFFGGSIGELVHRAEMRRKKLRRTLPNEWNPNRINQARQTVLLAGSDFVEEILCRLFRHAFEPGQGLQVQLVEIREILYELILDQLVDDLFSEPVDIHRMTPGKMENRLPPAGGARYVHAAVRN